MGPFFSNRSPLWINLLAIFLRRGDGDESKLSKKSSVRKLLHNGR